MVGIDAGAAVLALENVLMEDRVRTVFHGLPCVDRGLDTLGIPGRFERSSGVLNRTGGGSESGPTGTLGVRKAPGRSVRVGKVGQEW